MAIGRLAKVNISVPLLPEIELLLSDTINLYHFIKKKNVIWDRNGAQGAWDISVNNEDREACLHGAHILLGRGLQRMIHMIT